MPLTILGIAGSLRQASFNRALLRAAVELAPPVSVVDLKARIRAADAILFATPEYNFSIPGVLKNAIDWASRPYGDNAWEHKPVAIMGASPGMLGTVRAQY